MPARRFVATSWNTWKRVLLSKSLQFIVYSVLLTVNNKLLTVHKVYG